MQFGPVSLSEALGTVLAHSQIVGGRRIGKGTVLETNDIAALRAAGLNEVVVARLEPGDIGEDAAAAQLARALLPEDGDRVDHAP